MTLAGSGISSAPLVLIISMTALRKRLMRVACGLRRGGCSKGERLASVAWISRWHRSKMLETC